MHGSRLQSACAAALLLLALSASAADVASSAGQRIDTTDLQAGARMLSPQYRAALVENPANVRNFTIDLLTRRVIADRARAEHLEDDPVVAAQLRQASERVLHEVWLTRKMAAAASVEAAEALAREEYRAYPERFVRDAEVHARHILLKACACAGEDGAERKAAEAVLARLRKGEDFATLAAELSIDASNADKGGDLGFFGRGKMVPAFEQAAFALTKPGELSDLVETQFGYHIIRLEARRDAGQRSYEEVRDELVATYTKRLGERARGAEIDAVRGAADFRIDDEALAAAAETLRSEADKN